MLLTCCFREDKKTKKGNKGGPSISTYPKGGSIEDVVVVIPVPENGNNKKEHNIKSSESSKKRKRKNKQVCATNQDDVDSVHKTTEVVAELHVQEASNKTNRHSVGSNGSEILRSNSLASRQSSIQSNLKSSNGPNRDGSDRRDRKEKAPLQKEQKRLYKQKSQDTSLQVTSGIHLNASSATSANASSIPFIDQSPTSYLPQNASGPESKTVSTPSDAVLGKQGTHRLALSAHKNSVPTPSSECHQNEGTITILSAIGSPSNSSSTSYYGNTPNHQVLSSVSSNYDGQSLIPTQSATHTRRPNRNHNTTSTARSTPNLPTSTPVHNIHSPMFSTQSNQPILITQNGQIKQNHPREAYTTSTSSSSHTSSSINYHPQANNVTTHPNQTFLSSSTVSSTSAASVAAGRDAFIGNFGRQMSPSSSPVYNNQSSTSQLARVEEKVSGRGITRSSASYGIQKLLQDQINQEEKESSQRQTEKEIKLAVSKVTSVYEEKLSSMKADHDAALQKLQRDKETELNNARNNLETELKTKITEAMKTIEITKSQSSEMEIRKVKEKYEQEFKSKEEARVHVFRDYQERDQAWQNEKQDVLSEIQRLKEEAKRYLSLLSQEEDVENSDDQLSPSKKQCLTREVESLQLVVEMRTNDLHRLREEREAHLRQLEELDATKANMLKMSARVEDLQAQLDQKIRTERQLSMEKSYLENSYDEEGKAKARMSMQVEELQWRIKNNLELPATRFFSPTNGDDKIIATLSVASTPGKHPMNMSPFNDFAPFNKVRSRSVCDRKETSSEKPTIDTGAPPDVVQLRKHEPYIETGNHIETDNTKNNFYEKDNTITGEATASRKEVQFVPKNCEDKQVLSKTANMEVYFSMNEQNISASSDNCATYTSTVQPSPFNFVQPSKLPRPTTIGSLKNPHLPATNDNNNVLLHAERNHVGNLNLETSKSVKTVNLNDANISFEGVHYSIASTGKQMHLRDERGEKECPLENIEKLERLGIEKLPKMKRNANIGKIEDDNANLSDEGIIIGDVNSNANSEASNSPLPPPSIDTDRLNTEDKSCFNHDRIDDDQIDFKGAILQEDANCNNTLMDAKARNDISNFDDDILEHGKLSNQRKHNSIGVATNNKNSNNNNNNSNVNNPQMSSPCDDRVPSRIPLSVETN